jgi:hypothetical protein
MKGTKILKDIIKDILIASDNAKDCDYTLYNIYLNIIGVESWLYTLSWWLQVQKNGGYTVDNKYIACISVVSRRRRELQKEFPELQGTKYYKRQEQLQQQALLDTGYENKMTILGIDKGTTP